MGLFGKGKGSGRSIAELTQAIMTDRAQGRYAEAIEASGELDELLRRQFGETHVAVANNLRVLGDLHLSADRPDEAGGYLERALAIWSRTLGEDHATYAAGLGRLAEQRERTGRADEARELLERAIVILMGTDLGQRHPELPPLAERLAALVAEAPADPTPPAETPAEEPPAPVVLPTWKTVRVFLSSTFRDMHAERDHLVKVTFPRLRQWCAERRLHLVDIDLRWGVTKEEADNGKAIEICLQEIDGSRPFFVCLLGERYGWVPDALPPEERYRFHGLQAKSGCSITHLEIVHATDASLAADQDRRRPPCRHAFFYLRRPDCLPGPDAAASPPAVRETFHERSPELAGRLKVLKAWIRERFEPEGCVREYAGTWDPDAENPEDPGLRGRLVDLDDFGDAVEGDLRRAVADEFADHLAVLAHVDPLTEERSHHEAFLENRTRVHVPRPALEAAITSHVESADPRPLVVSGPPGSGKSAVLAHWARRWVGEPPREDAFVLVRFVGASAASTSPARLVANLAAEIVARFRLTEEVAIAGSDEPEMRPMEIPLDPVALREKWPRILEAAGRAGRVVLVLDALDQLDRSGEPSHAEWLVRPVPRGVRLVVSAAERARPLAAGAGDGAAATDDAGGAWLEALRRLELPELPVPPLDEDDCRRLVRELPSVFCKTLDERQVALLLENEAARNPLYLTVALEELRVFGSFEHVGDAIAELPRLDDPAFGGDVERAIEALFAQVLDRLDREAGRRAPGLVPALFALLASAREGLAESEIEALVAARLPAVEPRARTGAAQVVLRQVRPYLVRKGSRREAVVSFFHESFRRAVRMKYLAEADARRRAHRDLAAHFLDQPSWLEPAPARAEPNERKAVELVWQLARAAREADRAVGGEAMLGEWMPLEAPLTDLAFVAAKCACGLVVDLQSEYDGALAGWPGHAPYDPFDAPGSPVSTEEILRAMERAGAAASSAPGADGAVGRIEAFASFVTSHAHELAAHPEEAVTIARNEAAGGIVAERAEPLADALERPWLARDPRPPVRPARPAVVRTLEARLAAVTPDGRTGASMEPDGAIGVWDLSTGERRRTLPAAGGPLAWLALSSNGATIVAAHRETNLLERLTALTGGGRSPASAPAAVRVWDAASGARRLEIPVSAGRLAVADGGRLGLLAVDQSGLEAWDLERGVRLRAMPAAGGTVLCLATTPDGRRAIVAGASREAELWDVAEGRRLRALPAHGEKIAAVAISDDGRIVVSAGLDGWIRAWDVAAGRRVRELRSPASPSWLGVTASGRTAVVTDAQGRARLWNLESGVFAPDLPRHDVDDAGEPSTAGMTGPPPELLRSIRTNVVTAVELARHEPIAVTASEDSTVRLWNADTGAHFHTFHGHMIWVHDVADTFQGLVVSAGHENVLRVWDAISGCLRILQGHGGSVHAVDVAPDARTIVSGASGAGRGADADHTVRVWDLATGACLRILRGHGHWVRGVAAAPDARCVVSCGTDGTVRVWDLHRGEERRSIALGAGHVERVALSPDGRTIAAATQRAGVQLLEAATGRRLGALEGHAGRVNDVAFDAAGATIVTAGEDGTLRAWDAAERACLAVYPTGSPVRSVSRVRADGRLACGTADGRVHFLRLRNRPPAAAVVTASRRFQVADLPASTGDAPMFAPGETIPGDLHDRPTFDCPWCGLTFAARADVRAVIDEWRSILPDHGTAFDLALAHEPFADPRLAIDCAGCGGPLRVNPFLAERPPIEVVDWRSDPVLRGRFHPDHPDDVQVLVHDGHPGFNGRSPEAAWIRVHGRRGAAWTGTLLNQPYHLQSVREGDEVLFVASPSFQHAFQVTRDYLAEREAWEIVPCSKCGLPETFSPPSVLLEHTDVPLSARAQIRQLTAPCPLCDGVQILTRKGA